MASESAFGISRFLRACPDSLRGWVFLAVFSWSVWDEAPRPKLQAPGKLQIPSSNTAVIRRRSSVWVQPDRWPVPLTREVWNLELGASLELGVWCLVLRPRRVSYPLIRRLPRLRRSSAGVIVRACLKIGKERRVCVRKWRPLPILLRPAYHCPHLG